MTVAALVRLAVDAGVILRVKDDRLVLSSDTPPDEGFLHQLRSAKPAIVAYLRGLACWGEEDWSALHDERAGIMEFDGGLTRPEAEARAREEVHLLHSLVRLDNG